MKKTASNVTELIGNTPLLELTHMKEKNGWKANVFAKLEYLNPAGSTKDRAAVFMIQDAEEKGLLKAGGTIIEPTSGNTGIGLACIAAAKGYHVILTMPETMSIERQNILKAYGAKIILTEGALGMSGAIAKAKALAKEMPGALLAGQFENPANARAHYVTTGPEIYEDTDGAIDCLVAGVGTGGTITGTGRFLKEQNPMIQIIAVEPETSAVLSGKEAGAHPLQGIGAGFVPELLDVTIYDEVMTMSGEKAFAAAKELARTEGVLVGISSGAALAAAGEAAKRPEMEGKMIVVILPDSGDRYYSTPLFQEG
ncbi:MAG: cysteine synthase A [Lachnospiraceae bacterium]|nr:cysteine synthase A [Lachnospiraceae bacterium]